MALLMPEPALPPQTLGRVVTELHHLCLEPQQLILVGAVDQLKRQGELLEPEGQAVEETVEVRPQETLKTELPTQEEGPGVVI